MKENQEQKPLSSEEAAKYLNISKSHLYRLTHRKKISFYKPGKEKGAQIYFKIEDLDKYLYRNKISSTDELQEKALSILTSGKRNRK